MDFPLDYCPDGWARLERLRWLLTERPQDRICARMEVETNALRKFAAKYPPGYTERPHGRGTQDRRDASRIRPFQGRTLWGARFPGALPPATLSIPSGDQGWKAPRTFQGRKKQVKRLPVRSAYIAQLRRVIHRVSGEEPQAVLSEAKEESRMFMKMRRARFFAQFTLSAGRARFFASLRMTAKDSG
jgi:hypothetical protein